MPAHNFTPAGGVVLSRAGKDRDLLNSSLADAGRREFLLSCCQGASTILIPATLRGVVFHSDCRLTNGSSGSASGQFYLHPHYRSQRPLDALLLKTEAGLDDFVTEKYHDRVAAVLAQWSAGLLRSPQDLSAVEKALAPDFLGSSLQASNNRLVRSASGLQVTERIFSPETNLDRTFFLRELNALLKLFSQIITAEFQVTNISADQAAAGEWPHRLRTSVRYELVGTGDGFHREQRVGNWNLEWETSSQVQAFRVRRWQALEESQSRSSFPIFVDITASAFGSNVSHSAQLQRGTDYWRTVLDGACGIDIYGHNGISVADIDNDGFDDVYVCQPAGLPNRLYRNRGDGTFEDVTEASGLGLLDNTACALFADFNNRGLQDAVIVRASGPLFFSNQGGGKFRLHPDAFQFATPPQGTFTGAAAADYDRDGYLDIYFCLYVYYQGADQYKYPLPYHDAENGPPNFMMRNQRDGTFRDVTAESGLNQNNTRYSFCCGWSDFDRDGWPDLYVVNDFGRKNLYRNNGDGTFTDIAHEVNAEDVGAGMSVSWFDYDNDGAQDLYVGNMWTAAGERISSQPIFKQSSAEEIRALYRKHAMGNSLLRNSAEKKVGPFRDRTNVAGVSMGRWSWSSDAFDFDHDGFADLYIANGMISGPSSGSSTRDLNSFFWRQVVANSPDHARPSRDYEQGWSAINELIRADGTWSGYERNVFYANNGDGTFSNVSGAVGMDFVEDGRAFAIADFDGDGRQELFLKNRNAPQLRVVKNVIEDLPPSISFRLRGAKSNRDAIGVVVTLGHQTRTLQAGSGFLSQHSKEIFFGLGSSRAAADVSILWPSGLVQQLHELPLNHRIVVEEGSDRFHVEPFHAQAPPHTKSLLAVPEAESFPDTAETWLLVPVPAPDFSLTDVTGREHNLAALQGRPLLLNFWTSQSACCRQDLSLLKKMYERWTSQGLQVLTVNVDGTADPEPLAALARGERFSFPILRGSESVAATYNLLYRQMFDRHRDLGLPTSFLIDEHGNIMKLYQGPLDARQCEDDFRSIPRTDAERLVRALPFAGNSETFDFGRNNLSFGSMFFQRGYFEQAAAFFQRALNGDPNSAESSYGLGSAYLNLQKISEARENFERATRQHASYPGTLANAWNNLGLIATREGNAEEAVEKFREAVRLSPEDLIPLNNLGNAYRLQKDWAAARNTFTRSLELSPLDADANYGLGMVYAQAEDTARAEEYLHKALQSRPDYPEALNNLGIVYLRTQRRNEAVATFEQCIRVAPAFDQAYLNLARVYSVEAAFNQARTVLQQLLVLQPSHAQAQSMLSQLPK